MNTTLRRDADAIVRSSIQAVLPDEAVRRALEAFQPKSGRVLLVAAGKAAWQMAHAAVQVLGRVDGGVVVTKYSHVKGVIPGVDCYEAGHPVPDAKSFAATEKALALVRGLTAKDTVLFLLSGGGSALFEKPLVSGAELQDITNQLLASGADIVEMNTIRKRLAFIAGGETVVHLTGKGLGGRNQELALAAAPALAGLEHCCVFSVGSDGTDGPTDAAGGFVDSTTQAALKAQGCDIFATLADNDAYHALQKCNGLIITGPTGTNVNDVSVALVRA